MPEGSYRFQIGAVSCSVLADGYTSYPAPWLFPNVDPVELARSLAGRGAPLEQVLCPYSCLLMQTGRRVLLVDTGAGQASSTAGALMARLEMEGVRPRDVDTVILTHAHPGHIGGSVDASGRPAFPHAGYVISECELEFWTAARPDLGGMRVPDHAQAQLRAAAARALDALRHQLEPVRGETEILPGFHVLPAPGHTSGHMAVLLSSRDERLLHIGDAAVHPLHLEHPDWENGFDLAPQTACATRRALLERAAADGTRIMAFHFPFPSVGRVDARTEGGWAWSPGR